MYACFGVCTGSRTNSVAHYGILAGMLAFCACATAGTTYEVGDGQPYAAISDVPLESLQAGDVVLIHWREAPYYEKWVIAAQGTAAEPVIFRGVPGSGGELPIIDGENATTRLALDFWNENRGVVKVGGSSYPPNNKPTYIQIENLDIRGGRPPATFLDDQGNTQTYATNAAAIFVEWGTHVTIRNCILRDSGNGLFVSAGGSAPTSDILIESNYIHSNGIAESIYHHNTYTAAVDITYQFNRFGPLADGAGGNNLKDRSAGLVVRYNWIEGANRQLDLVDAEDSEVLREHPHYHETFVYGNVLIEPANAGNRQILHYGGDSGSTEWYRKGTLYFYHNTIVSTRTDRTTLMRLSTMQEHCDARNNIIFTTHAGSDLELLNENGTLNVSRNWIKPGWVKSFVSTPAVLNDDGTWIEGSTPGFVDAGGQDFTLASDSLCLDYATSLLSAVLPDHDVTQQYVKHQQGEARVASGAAADLGAFECTAIAFDYDGDGAVDVDDWLAFQACLAGPDAEPDPSNPPPTANECQTYFDSNGDTDVDLADTAAFQVAFGLP